MLRRVQIPTIAPAKKVVISNMINDGIVNVVIAIILQNYDSGNILNQTSQIPKIIPAKNVIKNIRIVAGVVNVIIPK